MLWAANIDKGRGFLFCGMFLRICEIQALVDKVLLTQGRVVSLKRENIPTSDYVEGSNTYRWDMGKDKEEGLGGKFVDIPYRT